MLIDNLGFLPDCFKDGVRGIMLLHRNKDGEKGNAQRKAIKKVSRNIEEWHEIVLEFKNLQFLACPGYRIYSSVNSRNIDKAIHEFKLRQIAVDYGSENELDWFYKDIQNRFFSCLMNPNCRNQNNFLIDCDSEEEYFDAIKILKEDDVLFDYCTKNGRHIICKPFNPNDIELEPKKDEMIYIG